MKHSDVLRTLKNYISELSEYPWLFSVSPKTSFTRTRKLPFDKVVSAILAFRAGSLNHELMDFFGLSPDIVTASAFIQQRAKILPEAFQYLFLNFSNAIQKNYSYKGLRLLAVDGSSLQIAANPHDPDSYFPGSDKQKHYNLLHINAMYDLLQCIYTDALVQKKRLFDESGALTEMVDRSSISNALLMADRGYESYNNLAHIQEKGWKFLIRIKDSTQGIVSGLNLPSSERFDIPFHLQLTKQQTNLAKELFKDKNHYKHIAHTHRFDFLPTNSKRYDPLRFYTIDFRIVRFPISETTFETIITNLPADQFPAEEIRHLYAMRWGIETSFRDLKHTLGLLHLHSKKVEFIYQEIFAKLTMYNFCEAITQSVVIQQNRKYDYKITFSNAVHICLEFFLGKIPPPNVEALLTRYISPIRPGRKNARKQTQKNSVSFTYRVA